MKLLLVTTATVMVVIALSDEDQWQEFKRNNGKSYRSLIEEKKRFNIFQSNLRLIEAHNERFEKGEVTYKEGITVFTDITDEEFKSFFTPLKHEISGARTATYNFRWSNPKSINWTAKGAVGKPILKGKCGCCYAIGAAEAIEARVFIKTGILEQLSVQNIVDCSKSKRYGNRGCLGGTATSTFKYVKDHGILLESQYPYVGFDQYCMKKGGVKIKNYYKIPSYVLFMQLSVANTGPIYSSVHASEKFKQYVGGIIDNTIGCRSNRSSLNHAVLTVGYGVENGQEYWICKNCWGTQWGENGYFRIKKGSDNICGINTRSFLPVL